MKAPIRYFGSKWRIAEWIVGHLPPHETYVEVFGGSAAVLLSKPRAGSECYNDVDGAVVDFFRTLRSHPEELARAAALTPFAREEHALSFEPTDNPVERARRFLVRSWQTRGGYRRTGVGSWWANVSTMARHQPPSTWANVPTRLVEVAERLRGVHIEHADWRDIVARWDSPSTLFYCDPPYMPETRSAKWEYLHEFNASDHAELLQVLSRVNGAVVLSGYRSPLYETLGWAVVSTANYTQQGTPSEECLWLSRPSSRQLDMFAVPL